MDAEILPVPDLEFFTYDYPHEPVDGDVAWRLMLRLDDGRNLALHLGRKGRDTVFWMLIADCCDSGEPEPMGMSPATEQWINEGS